MEVNTEFNINITKTNNSKIDQIDFNNIPFGQIYSDHMLIANFVDGKWDTPEIKPFENMSFSPAMSALHYGQSIFEGMKAFKTSEGAVQLFRPYENLERFGINSAAICSNDVKNYPEDSFENMIAFSKENNFSFPYLHDEMQDVAKIYDAVCTPDFFAYNGNLELQYRGRIKQLKDLKPINNGESELFKALKLISETGKGPEEQHPSMGCNIKWIK